MAFVPRRAWPTRIQSRTRGWPPETLGRDPDGVLLIAAIYLRVAAFMSAFGASVWIKCPKLWLEITRPSRSSRFKKQSKIQKLFVSANPN